MILVTGGIGYIGSHTCVALAQAGHQVLILDNLCNSREDVLDRLERLCGRRPGFVRGDVRDAALLDEVFRIHPIRPVIHFAGLKAGGESIEKPLEYYENNVVGTFQLLAAMRDTILRVNGVPVDGFSSLYQIYSQVRRNRALTTVQVEVARQGSGVTKTYRLR